MLAIMHAWKTGRAEIHRRAYGNSVTESELTNMARSKHLVRVRGVAIFMAGSAVAYFDGDLLFLTRPGKLPML